MTAPKKNGVSTDASAKMAPRKRCCSSRSASCRKAKPAPRSTMPSTARLIGIDSVVMIEAKAGGNAVQVTTRQKISQTWLTSQTGPMARLMSMRGSAPSAEPPANRSQKPAPKSAPPKMA